MEFIAIFYVIFFVVLLFSIILMSQHVLRQFHASNEEITKEDDDKIEEKEKKMMVQRQNEKKKIENKLQVCSKERNKLEKELIKVKKDLVKTNTNLKKEKDKKTQKENVLFTSVVNSNELKSTDENQKPDPLEKCCFVESYNCTGKECKSGVEKRCGYFANEDCKKSLKLCRFMNKNECNKKPNNVYCEYDNVSNQCMNREMDYGFEINCSKYDRFIKEGYPNHELNCDGNYVI